MIGQHKIISEILVFAIGVVMVILVVGEFDMVRGSMEEVSVKDGLEEISNIIIYGILKTVNTGDNVSIVIKIPPKIWAGFGPVAGDIRLLSGVEYSINIENNELILSTLSKSKINMSDSIFKLEDKYTITSDVISNNGYITIKKSGNNINIIGGV